MNLILLDNQDSFVYNLADLFHSEGYRVQVYRNSTPAEQIIQIARQQDAAICLSPGPSHPRDAGSLMEVIALARKNQIPQVGICLGFQAMLEDGNVPVGRIGPVHGQAHQMKITPEGEKIFGDSGQVPVARYHSLGAHQLPSGWETWGVIADVIMAGGCKETRQAGVQFHPESILTPQGPEYLRKMFGFIGATFF